MKRIACLAVIVAMLVPLTAAALEIEEMDIGAGDSAKTRLAKAEKPEKVEKTETVEVVVEETEVTEETPAPDRPSHVLLDDRRGRFRVGLIGPGIAAANKGPGAMMTMGVEGEYFFFERLSAGLQVNVATEFDDFAIVNFLPYARYVFDLHDHPRWSLYVQAGVGAALYNGKSVAADIAIPGGGFWWQWTDNLSVGADAWFHVFVRGQTAVGFALAPAIRWQF